MTEPGLCGGCRHGRAIRSGRGSIFWLCRRSATDRRFARYPSLPVLACPGFEETTSASAVPASDDPDAEGRAQEPGSA